MSYSMSTQCLSLNNSMNKRQKFNTFYDKNTYMTRKTINYKAFSEWKNKVDNIVFSRIGKHLEDLVDNLYMDAYEKGYSHRYIANLVYNQNFSMWMDDFVFYIGRNINDNSKYFQKWFENDLSPEISAKIYNIITSYVSKK